MHVCSVNVGGARPIRGAGKSGRTGTYKEPVPGRVAGTASGLSGDVLVDRKDHGGRDQAVYVFGIPDYEWWAQELGRDLPPGTFGENLTITDLESASLRVGDRLSVGTAVLEITAPRIPCATLAVRMGEPTFQRRFRAAERPGVYCRVLREGRVGAGDAVSVEPWSGATVSVLEMFRDFFDPHPAEDAILRQLAAPIAVRARVHKERQLRALERRRV